MNPEDFYQKITAIAAQPPAERPLALVRLHTEVVMPYLAAVRALTAHAAAQVGVDGRTVGQVVGHIAEWERYTLLAMGEVIAGVRWPQIMRMSGYLEPEGTVQEFSSVAAFNAYQAAKHAACAWEPIQDLALRAATALQALFAHPVLVPWQCLEDTQSFCWQLPNGTGLNLACGWYLWMVTLEHEAVEHAADLGLADA